MKSVIILLVFVALVCYLLLKGVKKANEIYDSSYIDELVDADDDEVYEDEEEIPEEEFVISDETAEEDD